MLQWLNRLLLWYCGLILPYVDSQGYVDPVRNTLGIWSRLLGRMAQQHLPSDEELHFKVDENNLLGIKDLFPDDLFPTIVPGIVWDGKDFGKFQKIPFIWTTPAPLFRISSQSATTSTTPTTTTTTTTTIPLIPEKNKKPRTKRRKLRRKHRNSSSTAKENVLSTNSIPSVNEDSNSLSTVTQETPVSTQGITSSPTAAITTTTTATATVSPILDETSYSYPFKIRENIVEKETKMPRGLTYTSRKIRTSSEEMRVSVAEIIASEIMRRIEDLKENGSNMEHRIFIKIRSQNMDKNDNSGENNSTASADNPFDFDNLTVKDSFQESAINITEPEISSFISKKAEQNAVKFEEDPLNVTRESSEVNKMNSGVKQNVTEDDSEEGKFASAEVEGEMEDANYFEVDTERQNSTYSMTTVPSTLISLPASPFPPYLSASEYERNNRSVLLPVNDIIDGIGPLILPMFGYRPKAPIGYYPVIPNAAATGVRTYSPYDRGSQSLREYEEPTILSLGRAIVRQIYGERAGHDATATPSNTNAMWSGGYANESADRLYQAWLRQFSVPVPKVTGTEKQRSVGSRYVPIARPISEQNSMDPQLPIEQDARVAEMPGHINTAPAPTRNKFRNVPYKRYVPRPSEYHRVINSATSTQRTHGAALAHASPAQHTMSNAASSVISRVPSSPGVLSRDTELEYFGQPVTVSPQVGFNLLSQLYNKQPYQQRQQHASIPQELAQQPTVNIRENSQPNSAGQVYDVEDGYSMGRSKVRSDFFGDTGLLIGDQSSSLGNIPDSATSSTLQFGMTAKPQAEATPLIPPPNFNNKNSGGFGMGRRPDISFDEISPAK